MKFDFEALDFMGTHLLNKSWVFAKTMSKYPHWYTLRYDWGDDGLFNDVISTIRNVGYVKSFQGRQYKYVNINGMKYWTMGAPIFETILINRAFISSHANYDAVADSYDEMFNDEKSLCENEEIIAMLNYEGGSVLDVGCGTGLLLDYVHQIDINKYVGIDPSSKMLGVMKVKHPQALTIQTPFEEYTNSKVNLVVSLFGSANYIHPEAIARIPSMVVDGGRWFIMFFKDSYHPKTYERSGIEMDHYTGGHQHIPGDVIEYNDFLIVQGKK